MSRFSLSNQPPTLATRDGAPKPKSEGGKYVAIETWGCQMNIQDSENMLAVLGDEYTITTHIDDCDLVILNTCHIREKSYHKVMSRLGHLRIIQQQSGRLRVVVAGCVAQAEAKMLSRLQGVDVVVGPGRILELPQLLKQASLTQTTQIAVGFPSSTIKAPFAETSVSSSPQPSPAAAEHPPPVTDKLAHYASPTVHHGKNPVSRFLTIQKGCDNYCTFCVVPHTRGHEISYPPDKIIAGVKRHLAMGAREICLLGQNVNSYGSDLVRQGDLTPSAAGAFCDLLTQICELKEEFRLRFTTSNPHDFTAELAALFSRYSRLGRYYHLPVQSGSDKILAAMKRKVTRRDYLAKVALLKQSGADMAISTDIIVGFPGETEQDFEDTCSLITEVNFSFIYAFAYSPRKKTPASRFTHQIPEAIKKQRLNLLFEIQNQITLRQHEQELNQIRQVLVLYESKKQPGAYYGRTQHYRLVKITQTPNAPSLTGQTLPVKITRAALTCLEGERV